MSKRRIKKLPAPSAFRRLALIYLATQGVRPDELGLKNAALISMAAAHLKLVPHGSKHQQYDQILEALKRIGLSCPMRRDGPRPQPVGRWDSRPFDADHVVITLTPTQAQIDTFYASWDWKQCRYEFIKTKDRRCGCCGATPSNGVRIVVDHIKPIRRFWRLRLDSANLQLLCDDCNMGKGSRDTTDWRESAT